MIILGIETSCDETSCALVDHDLNIIANPIYSQLMEHSKYGGIVPEVASRKQIKKILPLYEECMRQGNVSLYDIAAIAVTRGPGLIGSLLVGLNFAKGLSFSSGKPIIGINHLEGHLLSNLLEHKDLKPPFLSLIVSGGHTLLVVVEDVCRYRVLGQTRDDAAGEAFDKVAKLLGLGYPGGVNIDKLAADGDPEFHRFPRARIKKGRYAFSFSGLKTAVVLYVRDKSDDFVQDNMANICAAFQDAAVEMLVSGCLKALDEFSLDKLAVAGGVAANSRLRSVLTDAASKTGFRVYFPSLELCTDNAAMIAAAGLFRYQRGDESDLTLDATAQMPLE